MSMVGAALMILGCMAIDYGISLYSFPASFIFFGFSIAALGLILILGGSNHDNSH